MIYICFFCVLFFLKNGWRENSPKWFTFYFVVFFHFLGVSCKKEAKYNFIVITLSRT